MNFFLALLLVLAGKTGSAQIVSLYDHLDQQLGNCRIVTVPGDGSCFFHAVCVPRETFKERILSIKNNQILTASQELQAYASSLNEDSPIFSHQHAEFTSNVVLPADIFTDAEAIAIAFGFRLEIYELAEDKDRAVLSAIYNPNSQIIRRLVIDRISFHIFQENQGLYETLYVGHYNRLEDGHLGLAKFNITTERCGQLDHLEYMLWNTHHRIATESIEPGAALVLKKDTANYVDQFLKNILTEITHQMNGRTDEYAPWIIHHTTYEIHIMLEALKAAYPNIFSS